jgi:phage-related holin
MDKISELRATIELLRKKLIKEQHKVLQATILIDYIEEELITYENKISNMDFKFPEVMDLIILSTIKEYKKKGASDE